jgi:hypothetical protein
MGLGATDGRAAKIPSCFTAVFFTSIGDDVLETGPLPK